MKHEELLVEVERRRLGEFPDYELVGEAMASVGKDELKMPPIAAGSGELVCADSWLQRDGRFDEMKHDDGELVGRRGYETLTAGATYVGRWPGARESAAYQIDASTAGSVQEKRMPFGEAIEAVLQYDWSFQEVANRAYQAVTELPGWYLWTGYGTFIKTDVELDLAEASITAEKVGFSDYAKGVDNLRVSALGKLGLHIPAKSILRITENRLQKVPAGRVSYDIPPDSPATFRSDVPIGGSVSINESGKLQTFGDGQKDGDEARMSIPLGSALPLVHDQLTWVDGTEEFYEQNEFRLRDILKLKEPSLEADKELGRQALSLLLETARIEPVAIGNLQVVKFLAQGRQALA